MQRILILADGEACVGKGTVSRGICQTFPGFQHIDSGVLYRAVGVIWNEKLGNPVQIARLLELDELDREDFRTQEAGKLAGQVAEMPAVRAAINMRIESWLRRAPGTVMDGRAGWAEFPVADVKLFFTATPLSRAERRMKWLLARNQPADFNSVLEWINSRDERDRRRPTAPMLTADEARKVYDEVIDNTALEAEQTLERALSACRARLA